MNERELNREREREIQRSVVDLPFVLALLLTAKGNFPTL